MKKDKEEAEKTDEETEELIESEEAEAEETAEAPKTEEEKKEETLEEAGKAEAKKEEAPAAEEKKAKPSAREKEKEEDIVEERIYTVPLAKAWIMPPNKRASRAMRMIRSFIIKHMKLEAQKEEESEEEEEPKQLVISNEVNEKVWERGIEKPPRKIRVRAAKDKDGNITVYLAEGD